MLGLQSTSYMADDRATNVLRQCVVKMVSVWRSFLVHFPQISQTGSILTENDCYFAKIYGVFMDRMAMSKRTDRRISIRINLQIHARK